MTNDFQQEAPTGQAESQQQSTGGYFSLPTTEMLPKNREEIEQRLRNLGEQVVDQIYLDDDNTEEVEHFNYKQKLRKKFSVASIVGLGFSLMNVPFGISTTLSIGLVCGGCVTIFWGWVIFGFFTTLVSLSLSEISAKFPTSGGVYHFSYLLANDNYALVSSWFDGWLLIIGNWLMFVSCAFGGSQFILSIFGLTQSNYKHNDWVVLALYIILVVLSALVNTFCQRYLEKFNKLCIYWTIYTILIMDILLLLFSTTSHDLHYVLTNFDASRSGWPDALAFIIGLVQFSSMTFNGYGSIPSMAEEVNQPEKTIPKGMVFSVLISVITGISFIVPILSILPDVGQLLDDNPEIFPIDIAFKLSTKSFLVSMVLVLLITGALTFAIVGSLTTASRTVYAFGRDHGLPYNYLWQEVDTLEDAEIVPLNALILSVIMAIIFGMFSLLSSSAFNAFVGCSVIALNISNGIPILSSILNKRRKIRGAAFKLRKFGYIVNVLSVFFICCTVVLLSFPPSRYIDVRSMNYAFPVFFVFLIIVTVLWKLWGKHHFKGPEIDHEFFMESGRSRIELDSMQAKADDTSKLQVEPPKSLADNLVLYDAEPTELDGPQPVLLDDLDDTRSLELSDGEEDLADSTFATSSTSGASPKKS